MTDFLLLAFVFLVAGVVSVPIASRLGLGSVLGYLIAGIVISPILLLLDVDVVSLQHFAEFGVVMMLFLVGLELEPKRLWEMRARLLGLGGGQVGITVLACAAGAMLIGMTFSMALAVGFVLALSSTAIVLQTLTEKGLMRSDGGQSSFSVLLTQDIAVIPMLAIIPLLAMPDLVDSLSQAADAAHGAADAAHSDGHDDGHGGGYGDGDHGSGLSLVAGLPGWAAALVTLGAIAAVIFIGARLTGPIFRFIAKAGLRELFVAAALMIVIGIALLMSLVGLSPALGTFLAGVVLANSEYRHELESDIDPFKGLLLGLFFMTVGAGINFALLFDNFAVIIGLTLGVMALKAAVLYGLAIVFKIGGSDRWLFSLGLAQAGEFGFVLLSFMVANSVLPGDVSDRLLLVVALSMLLTPALFILYDRVIAPKFSGEEDRKMDAPEPSHIIIAGHGRFGGIVARLLRAARLTPTVIDYSAAQLDMLKAFGIQAYYGDATRPDLLAAAGIAEAKMLVIAIDDKHQITELTRYVRQNFPDVHIVARALDRPHVYELWDAGCRDIIRETYDSSLRASRSALEALGLERAHAQEVVDAFNTHDRRMMIEASEHWRPELPLTQNPEYMRIFEEKRPQWQATMDEAIQKALDGKSLDGGKS